MRNVAFVLSLITFTLMAIACSSTESHDRGDARERTRSISQDAQSGRYLQMRQYTQESEIPRVSGQTPVILEIRDFPLTLHSIWVAGEVNHPYAYVFNHEQWKHAAVLLLDENENYLINVKRSDGKFSAHRLNNEQVITDDFPVFVNGQKLEPSRESGPSQAGNVSLFLPKETVKIEAYRPPHPSRFSQNQIASTPQQGLADSDDQTTVMEMLKALFEKKEMEHHLAILTQVKQLYESMTAQSPDLSFFSQRIRELTEEIQFLREKLAQVSQRNEQFAPSSTPQIRISTGQTTLVLNGTWNTFTPEFVRQLGGQWQARHNRLANKRVFQVDGDIPGNFQPVRTIYDLVTRQSLTGEWEVINGQILVFVVE